MNIVRSYKQSILVQKVFYTIVSDVRIQGFEHNVSNSSEDDKMTVIALARRRRSDVRRNFCRMFDELSWNEKENVLETTKRRVARQRRENVSAPNTRRVAKRVVSPSQFMQSFAVPAFLHANRLNRHTNRTASRTYRHNFFGKRLIFVSLGEVTLVQSIVVVVDVVTFP